MMPFRSSRGGTLMLGVLIIVSFLLMTFDIRSSGEGVAGTLRSGTQSIFSPFQKLAQGVIDPVVGFVDALADLAGLREENNRLRAERDELLAKLAEAEAAILENEELRALLALQDRFPTFSLTTASIIGGGGTFDLTFTIDKGSRDGIVVDSPVLDENGYLVGIVANVSDGTSVVTTIVASNAAVMVRTDAGDRGLVLGQGTEDQLRLEIYQATGPVTPQTVLQTSRDDDRNIPDGITVGVVTEQVDLNVDQIVTDAVEPFADFARLRFVTVLGVPPGSDEAPVEPPETTVPVEDTTDTTTGGDT